LVVGISFVLLLHSSATAGPDGDALIEFGLLGAWAIDCTKPPSRANMHVTFAIRNGLPTRTVRINGVFETMEMRELRVLAPDRLTYYLHGPTKESSFNMMVAKIGEEIRSHETVRADGLAIIKNGKFVASGEPTRMFQRCSHQVSSYQPIAVVRATFD
jgi:hypothetical protein